MRRRSPGATLIAEEQRKVVASLALYDPHKVIAALEELCLQERRDKLRRVIESRVRAVTVVMDAPHDPFNGAAVVRSCDAFGVAQMHVVERTDAFLAARAVARGSERWVDVITHTKVVDAVSLLRADGYELCATHPEGKLLPSDLAKLPRVAIVLGNERDGIGDDLAASCETSVRIPMRGFAESLNVSVTAAILLEQATRDRPGDLTRDERDMLYARALVLSVLRSAEVLEARGVLPERSASAPLPSQA